MTNIIACIDGSKRADEVCDLSSWLSSVTGYKITLLHVAVPHHDVIAKGDLSGSIGLGAQNLLLEELTEEDEEHGKQEQKKGAAILKKAEKQLKESGTKKIDILHRRGSIADVITEVENEGEIFVIGKSGEDSAGEDIGSNLEEIVRCIKKPLFVTTNNQKDVKSFVIAYDGSKSAKRAVEYFCQKGLFKDIKCHLLRVDNNEERAKEVLKEAQIPLKKAGYKTSCTILPKDSKYVSDTISHFIKDNGIDLLVIGAYGHSKIRNLILGSKTSDMIIRSKTPILLFH